jgi:hypothetical protein
MKNRTQDIDPFTKTGKKILITTFFFTESLKNGKYEDRYFPELFEYLRQNGYDPIIYPRFPTEIDAPDIVDAMRNSFDSFIIPEDHLSFIYNIRIIYAGIQDRYKLKIDIPPDDILHPLRKQIENDVSNTSVFLTSRSYLTYFSALRIFDQCANLHSMILWYENQYDDRAIAYAMHRKKKNVPIIGYQGFLHYSYYFNTMPVQTEVDAGVSPNLILIAGSSQQEYISRYSNLPSKTVSALRYSHVHKNIDIAHIYHKRECIIVLLPYELDHACEILSAVQILAQWVHLPISIKPHHAFSLSYYENVFGNKMEFSEYNETVSELYTHHPIIIGGTSSVSVETISCGIPTIFFMQKTTIALDPLPNGAPHYYRCYTPEGLRSAIHEILQYTQDDLHEIEIASKQIRDEHFTPITPDTMKPFLYPDE